MTIHKLKPPKSKSHQLVIDTLTDALSEARQGKYTAVAIAMVSKDSTYTPYTIIGKQGTFCELAGTIDLVHSKVMDSWKYR